MTEEEPKCLRFVSKAKASSTFVALALFFCTTLLASYLEEECLQCRFSGTVSYTGERLKFGHSRRYA